MMRHGLPAGDNLFERLEGGDAMPARHRVDPVHAHLQAIKRHLQWLLNVRRGSAPSCPELGLDDLNAPSDTHASLADRLCHDVRRVIERHEPRVRVTEVRAMEGSATDTGPRLRVACIVPLRHGSRSMEIDLALRDGGRRFHVS